jgi:hypothetical protein
MCCILPVISPNRGYINKTSEPAVCNVKSHKHNFSYNVLLLPLHAPTSSFSLLWSGAHMTSGGVCHEGSGEDRGYGGKDAPAPSSHISCSKMLPAGDATVVHLAGWDLEAARDNLSVLLGPVFYNFAQHTTPHLPYIDKRTIRECKDACRELHIGMCATRSMTAGLRHMDSRDW